MFRFLVCTFLFSSLSYSHANIPDREKIMRHPANRRLSAALARIYHPPAPVVRTVRIARQVVLQPSFGVHSFVDSQYEDIYRLVEIEAARAKVSPVTMFAIMWHETGGFRSPLWRNAYNPGGIKFSRRLAMHRRGAFCKFLSAAEGIRAEAEVLLHSRYDSARETQDPYQQAAAISSGGYAEYSSSWLTHVNRYISRFNGDSFHGKGIQIAHRHYRRHRSRRIYVD